MIVAFDVGPVRDRPAGVGLYATAMANALEEALPPGALRLIGRRPDAAGLPGAVPASSRSARLPYPAWIGLRSAHDAKLAGADIVHYADGLVPIVRHGRTVLAVHDMSVVRQRRTHSWPRYARIPFALLSPRLADLVIVPSRATADEVMRLCGVPANRVEVIPYAPQHGVMPAEKATIAGVLRPYDLVEGRYILALGTIEPRKNHLRLISAFEALARRGEIDDDIVLAIAGQPGWGHQSVMAAIATSPVSSRIRVPGYVPGDALPALLTGARAVAYVSLSEGFGLPVVEAMACGAPTVTSNCSSMPEVAGEAGFLVDPTDPEDIARGLLEAMSLPESERLDVARRSIGQARHFDWPSTARAVADVYGRLIGG
jgi:glycosyltransferase involved in cell wall biosynthesis